MALTQAFAIDGGKVNAATLRAALWASTSGATGVVRPRDLKVSALAVPGGAVNIAPGGALMESRYSGSMGAETYTAQNRTTVQLSIPATTAASGRSEFIILRIDDWHFTAAQAPADPATALYCSFQRVGTLSGITYPYVALARIVIPASTGTITDAMIQDIREVAIPREKTVLRVNPISTNPSETETLTVTAATGEWWPNAGGLQTIPIPSWATRAIIRADWIQAYLSGGDVRGNVWVQFGDWDGTKYTCATEKFSYNNPNTTSTANMRATISAVGDIYIPSSLRGRDIAFRMFGQKVSGAGARMDQMAGTSLEVKFLETADPSDS